MTQKRQGTLFLVGLGPGAPGLMVPEAAAALERAEVVIGYQGYLDRIADRLAGKELIGLGLGREVDRAELALRAAESGRTVALVSSGDAGVYGMAGLALELAEETESPAELIVVPGVTAALAASALLGAPLAHDWASISLSDLLTPWPVIRRRIEAAARADFVIVLYNPASKSRTWQLGEAARRLLEYRRPDTPVGLVENAYRPGQRIEVIRLDELTQAHVSMLTTVIVGNSQTRQARRGLITPRIYAAKTSAVAVESSRSQASADPILAESLALIDRELGTEPADPAERAVVMRMIHASADFDFPRNVRFGPGFLSSALGALRSGAPIITDVEMLRAGIRRELADPLGVSLICGLADLETAPQSLAEEGLTRTAMGLRRAASRAGDGSVVAIGNAPTALVEALRLVHDEKWRPACILGVPVGFVGVEAAKRSLVEQDRVPFLTVLGRKGGTAATAAALNALLALAGQGSGP